jgi:hypothetical protein
LLYNLFTSSIEFNSNAIIEPFHIVAASLLNGFATEKPGVLSHLDQATNLSISINFFAQISQSKLS